MTGHGARCGIRTVDATPSIPEISQIWDRLIFQVLFFASVSVESKPFAPIWTQQFNFGHHFLFPNALADAFLDVCVPQVEAVLGDESQVPKQRLSTKLEAFSFELHSAVAVLVPVRISDAHAVV